MVVLSHLHNIHMQRCLASHFTTIFPLVDLKKKGRKILHFSKDNSLFSSKHGKTQKSRRKGKANSEEKKINFSELLQD